MKRDQNEVPGGFPAESVSASPISLYSNLMLVAEVLKNRPQQTLYVYDLESAEKFRLCLNSMGQVCFVKKTGGAENLLLVSARPHQLVLGRESMDIIDRYIANNQNGPDLNDVRKNCNVSFYALLSAVSAPPLVQRRETVAEKPIEVPEKKRSLTLLNICKELTDREGVFSFVRLPNGRLKIVALFSSERRAAFMQRKFTTRWNVDCTMDWQDKKKLVIEDSFETDEIEMAEKQLKINIPH